jgi:hypothetical protein
MNFYQQRLTPIVALILCCCLATPLPVMAETDAGPDRWKMGGSAYLWFSGIEATSVAGDKIDISFSDALDSLDGGIMGRTFSTCESTMKPVPPQMSLGSRQSLILILSRLSSFLLSRSPIVSLAMTGPTSICWRVGVTPR